MPNTNLFTVGSIVDIGPKHRLGMGQPDSKGDRAFIAGVIAPTAAEEGEKQQQQCRVLLFANGKFMLRRQRVNGAAAATNQLLSYCGGEAKCACDGGE
jgi:hypothetical protein